MNTAAILKELISIPSVNTMGRNVSGPIYGESRLSDWLMGYLRSIGATCERISVSDGHDNVVALFAGQRADRTLLLDVHQDTVPIEGMTIDPFGAEVRNGRIYGRGASDVKGSMAAMLTAFARLHTERPQNTPNVLLSLTCDEENTATGITDLVNYWQTRAGASQLISTPPDAAIVAEPTDLNAVIAHRGVLRFRVRTRGRACHSSDPTQGDNAIYRMAPVIAALEQEAARLASCSVRPDSTDSVPTEAERCGPPTLSVGVIHGGLSVNIVPDECVIEIDRRLIPGEDPLQVHAELAHAIHTAVPQAECEPPWINCSALSPANNQWLAERVLQQTASVVGKRSAVVVPYCTNASALSGAGVPTIVFGPGSIEQAHTCDEFIELAQVDHAADIYYRICLNIFDQ